jgi:GNAT superfamily N-acetyltransferase
VVEPADRSRRIVGTFGIECRNSDTTELQRMYIDAGWRGRGLAAYVAYVRGDGPRARLLSHDRQHRRRPTRRVANKSGFKRVRSEIAEAMTVKQAGGGLLRHYFEKVL